MFAALDLDTDRPTAGVCICININNLYCYVLSAGRLCEHIETEESAAVAEDCNSELQEYLDTLNVTCEGNETSAAILTWTPDENTPDIVYYQVGIQPSVLMCQYRVCKWIKACIPETSTAVGGSSVSGMGNFTRRKAFIHLHTLLAHHVNLFNKILDLFDNCYCRDSWICKDSPCSYVLH